MGMRVDESRQQRGVAEIDHFGAGGDRSVRSHGRNFSVGHNDNSRRHQRVALPIEEPRRLQHRRLAGSLLRVSRCGKKRQGAKNEGAKIVCVS